ncbi:MAG: hypothetical protein ACPGSC_11390, partial [Granulosicoccaceae bacterium]
MSYLRFAAAVSAFFFFNGASQAITLEDYVDPNSAYEDAYAVGSFSMANKNYNTNAFGSQEEADDGKVFQTSYDLSMSATYRRVFNSLPLGWTYRAELVGQMNQASFRDTGADKDSSSSENVFAYLEGNYDRYLDSNPNVFWFGGGNLRYDSNFDDPSAEVLGGVGYGRVINATPLAKALRVMEDFQRFGLLTAYPSDVVMMEIAQIINKEEEYESKYGTDDYRRVWYEAIETVLMGGGLINGDGLGALGVIKLDDILEEEIIRVREHGWRATAGVSYVIRSLTGEEGDPGLSLGFRYAKPYGYKGQLIEDVSFVSPLDGDGDTTLQNELTYTYEVSDVVDWQNSWRLTLVNSDNSEDVTSNAFTSAFIYEISNVLEFNVTMNLFDGDDAVIDDVGVRG